MKRNWVGLRISNYGAMRVGQVVTCDYIKGFGMIYLIRKLNAEIVKILKKPTVSSYLAKEGAVPMGSSPTELAATMQAELTKWEKVILSANIKFE